MTVFQRISWLKRLLATALAYSLFGIGGLLVPLISIPVLFLLPGGRNKRQQRTRNMVHYLFKSFIYFMKYVGILTWKIDNINSLQRQNLLVLANHPTLLDVVFLVAFIPNATCIVKNHLRNNPAMRGFITLTGYITNDSAEKLIVGAKQALLAGSALVVFPEGTRSREGQPLTFQRGAANIAVRCNTDITPVVIHCSPPTLSKQHKWYHIPDRPFVMSFSVKQDIAIVPFTTGKATLNSRKLTRYLEKFFTKEYEFNADPIAQ